MDGSAVGGERGEEGEGEREDGGMDHGLKKVNGVGGGEGGEGGERESGGEGKEDRAAVAVARAICRNAIRDLPESFSLRVRLLETLREASGKREYRAGASDHSQTVVNGRSEMSVGGEDEESGSRPTAVGEAIGGEGGGKGVREGVWLTGLEGVAKEVEEAMLTDFAGQAEAVKWVANRVWEGRGVVGGGGSKGTAPLKAALKVRGLPM